MERRNWEHEKSPQTLLQVRSRSASTEEDGIGGKGVGRGWVMRKWDLLGSLDAGWGVRSSCMMGTMQA